ncbi:668_t:CDS:1, partial [Funneliformis caledonium]
SVRLDCPVTLKQGLFPRVISELPGNSPRDEHLAEILLRKDELTDLGELLDELLDTMEKVFQRPSERTDLISINVIEQLVAGWGCRTGNFTCAQDKGASTTVRYVGALLEAASIMYPVDYLINVDELIGNSTSTGTLTATHKVCKGGRDPMISVGLMISVPLLMIIVELLPLLFGNKVWWLASDIGFKHIALLRSTRPCGTKCKNDLIDLPKCTTRPGEIPCQTIVRFSENDDHFGLSSDL